MKIRSSIVKIKNHIRNLGLFVLGVFLLFFGCQENPDSSLAKSNSVEAVLSTFVLEPGFKIELVASEPLINDPVDMEIDENGIMYVVEMKGVPFDESGSGSIKALTDTDGDGVFDQSTVFADSLILPNGVMRWKKGLLVTDPPNVYYFEDTDGDKRADIRKIILTGFDSNDLESNVNNPLFGLDNWIYLANGPSSRDKIQYPDRPNAVQIDNSGNMVRFRPDYFDLEMMSTRTQFGFSFDSWGNRFMVSNSNHIYQEMIAAKYLERNGELLMTDAAEKISDHGSPAEVFPITKNPQNQLLTDVGVFTAACGITNYLGGAFPAEFNDKTSFTAEPAHNLVHVDYLNSNNGAAFTASRFGKNQEFLASTDFFFRPVNMYVGPDGALYVVDMYRRFIEGPEFMEDEVVKTANLYEGTEKGRIYRISATKAAPATWMYTLALGEATNKQLVDKLSDPNIWWRRNAQRLLLDRKAKEVVPELMRIASDSESAMGRLHALWTLEGLNKLNIDLISNALIDKEPGIRENAIRLAEIHLSDFPVLERNLLALQKDIDPKVRYQLISTLGFINTPEANKAREQLLFKDITDEWVQIAALTAPSSQSKGLLDAVLKRYDPSIPAYDLLVQRLSGMVVASQKPEAVRALVKKATAPGEREVEWQGSLLHGIADGLKSRESIPTELKLDQRTLLRTFFENPSFSARKGSLEILQIVGFSEKQSPQAMSRALEIAGNDSTPPEQRALAVNFLSLLNVEPYSSFLGNLITPEQPMPVQLAAIKTLSTIPDETVSEYVLQKWPSLTPELRDTALNTFLVYPFNLARVKMLLDAIEKNQIQPSSLGWSRSVVLMRDIPDAMKIRSRQLLTQNDGERKDIIEGYQAALELEGDEKLGKKIFLNLCSSCHTKGGEDGQAYGPDLATVRNWMPEKLVSSILDPGLSITVGYNLWSVELKNGDIKNGIISSETLDAVTLSYPGGTKTTFSRNEIKTLTALNTSPMPTGLEQQISKQEMADIISYLKSW